MDPEEPTKKRQRLRQYRNRWGHVSQFDVPKWLINNELLSTPMKRTLVGLYFSQSEQPKLNTIGLPAIASVSIERLCDLTGLSKGTVSKSIRQLKAYGYIRQHLTVQKKGVSAGFAPAVYTFRSPTRFKLIEHVTLTVTEGKRLLLGNNIDYVTVPRIVLADTSAQYSLAKMTDPEFLVYFACLRTATRANVFTMPTSDLLTLTGLTMPTIDKALYGLRSRGLMNGKVITRATKETAGELLIEILDPASGKPIPPPMDDPEPEPGSYAKRPILKPADVERLLRERIPPGRYPITSTGNMNISCPDHHDPTPSLSVNLHKGGVWFCHECKAAGPFEALLAMLEGVPREEVASELKTLEPVNPGKPEWTTQDYETAILYPYKTLDGRLIRWKARNTRVKDFKWFHAVRGKAKLGKGPGPASLYHQELLDKADTVAIVEGEKDADTVTELYRKHDHPIIGVTSGSSTSWKPHFAKLLKGKRVVVMPDDTIDGAGYAEAVTASLTAEGIPYTVVTFRAESCKDVSDYMLTHTVDDLLQRINVTI